MAFSQTPVSPTTPPTSPSPVSTTKTVQNSPQSKTNSQKLESSKVGGQTNIVKQKRTALEIAEAYYQASSIT